MITIDRLRKVEVFQGLSDGDLRKASSFCQDQTFPKGTVLCEEGARADKLLILEEGSVSIRFQKGVDFCIQTPGKILGWSFLVPPNRYTASAVTLVSSKLLVIKSPDFFELVHKEPAMGLKIMENLAQIVASRLRTFVDIH
jgi:CRP/FNR family transcriptional regulator, cyclic AMP receptor protein